MTGRTNAKTVTAQTHNRKLSELRAAENRIQELLAENLIRKKSEESLHEHISELDGEHAKTIRRYKQKLKEATNALDMIHHEAWNIDVNKASKVLFASVIGNIVGTAATAIFGNMRGPKPYSRSPSMADNEVSLGELESRPPNFSALREFLYKEAEDSENQEHHFKECDETPHKISIGEIIKIVVESAEKDIKEKGESS